MFTVSIVRLKIEEHFFVVFLKFLLGSGSINDFVLLLRIHAMDQRLREVIAFVLIC